MPSQVTRTREMVNLSELGFDADADVERERLDHRWLYSPTEATLAAPIEITENDTILGLRQR